MTYEEIEAEGHASLMLPEISFWKYEVIIHGDAWNIVSDPAREPRHLSSIFTYMLQHEGSDFVWMLTNHPEGVDGNPDWYLLRTSVLIE